MKKNEKRELLKKIRGCSRLKTKPPKTETPATIYRRKPKHGRSHNEDFSLFAFTRGLGDKTAA